MGSVPQTQQVTVTLSIPLNNADLISTLCQAISDPNSPEYHQFLTSTQIADLFYPTEQFNQFFPLFNQMDSKFF